MSGKGFYVPQDGHVVNILPPQDINGSAQNSDVFSMRDHAHVDIILVLGTSGAASTVTIEECDDFTPSNSTAIAFTYYQEETAAGDTLSGEQAATTSGFATSTNNNIIYIISIDASQLSDGFPCLRLAMSDPSASTIVAAVAVLSGARYAGDQSETQIA